MNGVEEHCAAAAAILYNHSTHLLSLPQIDIMGNDFSGGDLVIDEALIDKVKKEDTIVPLPSSSFLDDDGKSLGLDFSYLYDDIKKLRDEHVISIIDNYCNADAITHIILNHCRGITDATLKHIATKCKRLEVLYVKNCVKITDRGIKAIVEKIGNNLKVLVYGFCNRCTNASLQSVVQNCPNLEQLFANNIGITKIPETIGHNLSKLTVLGLSNNGIKTIPPSIALLSDKLYFNVACNPLQDPAVQVDFKTSILRALQCFIPLLNECGTNWRRWLNER